MGKALKKFGQYVKITVSDEGGGVLLVSDDLRIDFDIRNTAGWARGKFSIYNLDTETVGSLRSKGRYVSVDVGLHDGPITNLVDGMYISNSMDERQVPDTVLNMFTYSAVKNAVLDKHIDAKVIAVDLYGLVQKILREGGYNFIPQFKSFPKEVLYKQYPYERSVRNVSGTVGSLLDKLAYQHGFNYFIVGGKLTFVYRPHVKNVKETDLYAEKGDLIVLSTTNMRNNPKLGIGRIDIQANLDPAITPGARIDISKLLTAGTSLTSETLAVTPNMLQDSVSGAAIYQVLETRHAGSNWTPEWLTSTLALSEVSGTLMKTGDKWFT